MEHPNDEMTGLPGREALREEISQRLERQEQPAVILLDVDAFASLNHDLWHVEGDKMLLELAGLLRRLSAGPVYRTGGGEFTLVMPQTTREQALLESARICALVSAHDFALPDGRAVTVTAGVAHTPDSATEAQTLLDAAADALLRGKHKAYLRQVALRSP